jgi:hypothetical protein
MRLFNIFSAKNDVKLKRTQAVRDYLEVSF